MGRRLLDEAVDGDDGLSGSDAQCLGAVDAVFGLVSSLVLVVLDLPGWRYVRQERIGGSTSWRETMS
jgi:hypothetical protein